MNKVELIGNITKDLELRYTQSTNKAVLNFTIAVNKRVNGENSADFINCVAWSTTAEFISKYFKKGQSIAVVGRLQNKSYEDSNGQKRNITEVVVEETFFVGTKADKKEVEEKPYDGMYENFNYNIVDELPF